MRFTFMSASRITRNGSLLMWAKCGLYFGNRTLFEFQVPRLILAIINQFKKK